MPHQLTIEILDAFGVTAGTAIVKWEPAFKNNPASSAEVHRVFAARDIRVSLPPGDNDPRMTWSLKCRMP
jgi:hypothetical protein